MIMIENDRFYMVADEVKEIFGELTEGEWKVWNNIVDIAADEKKKNEFLRPFTSARSISKDFVTFVNDSLNDVGSLFEYLVYDGEVIDNLFVYAKLYDFIDNALEKSREIDAGSVEDLRAVYTKLNSVCDTLISKILSIKYDEIEDAGLEFSENVSDGADEWKYIRKQCVELVALTGMKRLWYTYQNTDEYARLVAVASDARQEFLDLFHFNVKKDIESIDDKLTIVSNKDIYEALLPEKVLGCLEFQNGVKKEWEIER